MKSKTPFFALIFLLLCASACNKDNSPGEFKVGDTLNFQLNERKISEQDRLDVTLVGIQDGRCPCDAICVWEGEALLDLEVKYKGQDYDLKISSHKRTGQTDTLAKYVFQFIDIDPGCPKWKNDGTIDPDDYEVRLSVEKL